jgi:hypothetical protein
MDTFKYLSYCETKIHNFEPSNYHYILQSIDGSKEASESELYCEHCGGEIDNEDEYLGFGCVDCHTYCEDDMAYPNNEVCEIFNGLWYHKENVFYDKIAEKYDNEEYLIYLYDNTEVSKRLHLIQEDKDGNYFINGDENFIYNEETEEYERIPKNV